MSEDVKRTELISRYLSGEMDDTERSEFEHSLSLNASLKDEVELQKKLTHLLEIDAREKLRNKIQSISDGSSSSNSSTWKRSIAAIVIIGLLAVPAYFFFQGSSIDAPVLAEEYFEPYPDRITTMGADLTTLNNAMEFYNGKDYLSAIPLLEKISTDSSSALVSLYLSISYIEDQQAAKAISCLNEALQNTEVDSELTPTLKWYLILANLSDDKETEAKKLLVEYLKANHAYNREKALELSKELDL
jgi:predicted negative regulator of RcsB-dependent stress response